MPPISFRHAVEILRHDTGAAPALPAAKGRKGPVQSISTVPKLPAPVVLEAEDQELMRQVVDYYHETLQASPEALDYLAGRGLKDAEMLERFRVGFANRTLGLRLPRQNRLAGEGRRRCSGWRAPW